MTESVRVLLRNASLPDGRHGTLGVDADGRIVELITNTDDVEAAARGGATIVEINGRLVLPALAEPHAHLDKALTADVAPNPTGDLRGAIDAWILAESSGMFDHTSMVERVRRSLEMLLLSGVTFVRSHINVGGAIGISYLLAAQEAASSFRHLMDIEFVALIHMPMSGPGSEVNLAALDAAIDAGVDIIGGCPHLEPDAQACIDAVFERAERHGRAIDLHVDETLDPTVLTLELLAQRAQRSSIGVTASHCVSLSMIDSASRARVINSVARAGMSIVALPQTNLFLQGRDHPIATPRGLTPVLPLIAEGVNVAAGADNVQDPFNLVGRSDPLETASLMVMAGHVLPDAAFSMVSSAVRSMASRPSAGTNRGDIADLIAVPVGSIREAIAQAPVDRLVIRGGQVVAERTTTQHIGTR
jgi:cytosine deaminase